MPIAYSGGPNVYLQFTPATPADIVAALTGVLTSVGAGVTPVTGGAVFRLTSPQGLLIDLYIRDLGHRLGLPYGLTATLQFVTTDTLISGVEQELVADGRLYQAVAGPSQLFVSLVGVEVENQGGTYCGGIPFFPLASSCSGEIPALAATRGFFSMGDFNLGGTIHIGTTPRTTLIMGTDPLTTDPRTNCEALFNSNYCAPLNPVGSVRIAALTPAPYIFQGFNLPSPVLWFNGDQVRYEPALVWGDTNASLPGIRAQIWDALIFSKKDAMDHQQVYAGENYISFTNNYQYGSLNLLMPPTFDLNGGNYSFIAT